MKTLIQLFIALFAALMLLGGCQKKEEPATTDAPAATNAMPAPAAAPEKQEPGGWVPPAQESK